MMTVDAMIAEMQRRPDAHLLAEWTAEVLATYPTSQAAEACAAIDNVTAAYFDALAG